MIQDQKRIDQQEMVDVTMDETSTSMSIQITSGNVTNTEEDAELSPVV